MSERLKQLKDPAPESLGKDVYKFLEILGQPTCIHQTGIDTSRSRAYITLLHGNEPSGLYAVYKWLTSGIKPQVNLLIIVGSVAAALTEPVFTHRALPGKRDLNRCFKPPYEHDEEGLVAQAILDALGENKPEAAIDMHNTSGTSPSFAVATRMDAQHDALTTLFTNRLIVTDLRLGAIMEISDYLCPTVTIECGGRMDEQSIETAWDGIHEYFTRDNVLVLEDTDFDLEVLHNPVRLEFQVGTNLHYSDTNNTDIDVVLQNDIEHYNSGVTPAGTEFGWLNRSSLDDVFSCVNMTGHSVLHELLEVVDGRIRIKRDVKLSMITTNARIALSDCLMYAVNSDGGVINC